MKKQIFIILFICLLIAGSASAIRIGGGHVGHGVGMTVGSGQTSTGTPDGEVDSSGTYWGTAMTDRWDTAMTTLWDTAMNTEVP